MEKWKHTRITRDEAIKLLEKRRKKLSGRIASLNQPFQGCERHGDEPDRSLSVCEAIVDNHQRETLTKCFGMTIATLEKIEKGNYGICLKCEKEISPKRLRISPETKYCLFCKERIEGQERSSRPNSSFNPQIHTRIQVTRIQIFA